MPDEAGVEKEHELMEIQDHTITIEGLNVHYRSGGSGPHLLLLHGFSLSCAQWDDVLPDFMQRFTVIVPDLPGHGGSDPLAGPFSYKKAACIMLGLLEKLNAAKVYGIAHSGGAITMLHMVAARSDCLEAMVIIAGAHRMSISGREMLRNDRFEALDSDFQAYYLALHPGGKNQIDTIFSQMNGLGDNYEDSALSAEHLSTFPTRTLLVWGDRDPYFPLEFALEMYRAIPNAQLWVVPEQEHTPVWESLGGSAIATQMFPAIVHTFLGDGLAQ